MDPNRAAAPDPAPPSLKQHLPPAVAYSLAGLLAAGLLSIAALKTIASPGGSTAPTSAFLLTMGILLTSFTAGAMYFGMRSSLGWTLKTTVLALGYNALIVIVKFVVAPSAIYEVNQEVDFAFHLDEPFWAVVTAGLVFSLYLVVYWMIYRWHRAKLAALRREAAAEETGGGDGPQPKKKRGLILGILAAGAIVATAGTGLGILIIPLFLAANSLQYLSFVFNSGLSIVVSIGLAGAIALAMGAFASATDRALLLRDATLLTTFFWVGLSLIAVYHVLWVVYILALTTIWPLRVVVPK